jgi:hypothetical protein
MNKKEIKSAINKQAFTLAGVMGYDVSDDGDGSNVTFWKPGSNADDSIEWSRSYHETCVLNWASEQTKKDASDIDEFMKPIIKHYNAMYSGSK